MADIDVTITNLGAHDGRFATSIIIRNLLITEHEVNVKPNFSSTSVYGRMDPIFTYQNTVRTFTLNFKTAMEAANVAATRNQINKLHQMMYPSYETEQHGLLKTYTLKGPPILEITCPGVFNSPAVFIPENFSLTRGTANSSKINITVGSLGELASDQAPVDGYAFTIGGTILHQDEPPGWISDGNGNITFSKGADFPLGS